MTVRTCALDGCNKTFTVTPGAVGGAKQKAYCCGDCQRLAGYRRRKARLKAQEVTHARR